MKAAVFALFALTLASASATSAQAQNPSADEVNSRLVRSRAVEAVIWGMPAVNYDLMLQEMLTKTAGKVGQVIYWGRPLDWRNQTLTPNPDTLYFMTFFNTKDGPAVLDFPAASQEGSFNGNIVNIWQMPLEDAGLLGADKGAGIKFVLVPPGYKDPLPDGYTPLQLDTNGGYLPPTQRIVVTPNNDTFYGAAFINLGAEPVVVQTPTDVPAGHYWTMQITDVFTNVIHTIGSGPRSQLGKYLLVGPDWKGQKPDGFVDVLRLTTNYGGVFPRSFAARTPEAKRRAIAVQDQMGVYPLSQNQTGPRKFDCEAISRNKVYPSGVTADMVAADPDLLRPQWVVPERFWEELETMLKNNPTVSKDDTPMAEQARTLVALRKSSPAWKALLDEAALAADVSLHTSAKYEQVGVDAGNGWQKQNDGGLWGSDWFGRAQAAVIYVLVNDYHEAVYFIRGTDSKGALLDGKHRYTMTFPKDAAPPVDRSRGGFWSLTMYDKDYFMLPKPANGRTNIGTVSLDANELKFAADGSLTLTLSRDEPADADAKANWLPSPDGQFALIVRAYVPTQPIIDGAYKLPNVERK